MLGELLDGFGYALIVLMPVKIHEEEILPRAAFAGAGLDLGHVDLELAERRKDFMQRPDLIRQAQHDAGAVVAGGRAALAAQDQKARGVRGVILDITFEDVQLVTLRRDGARDGRRVGFYRRQFRRTGVGGRLDDLDVWQVVLDPTPALSQRLGMSIQPLDVGAFQITDQTVLDG